MSTAEIIAIIFFVTLSGCVLAGGIFSVWAIKMQRREPAGNQKYVKENLSKFGANNRGSTMDGQEIYSASPSDMGF